MSRPKCRKTFDFGVTLPEEGLTILHVQRIHREVWCFWAIPGGRLLNPWLRNGVLRITVWKETLSLSLWDRWTVAVPVKRVWLWPGGTVARLSSGDWRVLCLMMVGWGTEDFLNHHSTNSAYCGHQIVHPQVAALPVPASGLGEQKLVCLFWRFSTQSAAFSYRC